jgi:hypothetical protein
MDVSSIVTTMAHVDPVITIDSLTQARSAKDDQEENDRQNREALERSQLVGESTPLAAIANRTID